MFRTLSFKLALLGVLIAPVTVRAQEVITTSNASVAADVMHDGTGLISIYRTGTFPKQYVTYPDESFLTVLVNQKLYTNNPHLPDSSPPAVPYPPILLTNGVDTLLQNTGGNDVIRTIWSPTPDFDIIQDVYPVLFPNGGQIVISIQVVNHSDNLLSVQAQYLMDVDIVSPLYSSDNAKIATEYGYTTLCETYSENSAPGIPPFYIAFSEDLGVPEFPGSEACGFLNDTFAAQPLGLMQPSTFTIVDWPTIVPTYSWGWPDDLIGSTYSDEALLIQWPFTTINPRSGGSNTIEIARTSFGVGGYKECKGNLDAFTFYPYLQHEQHFPVTSLIFNSRSDTLIDVVATLSVDSFFRIVSPYPLLSNGLMQTQSVNPDFMPPATMSVSAWSDTLGKASMQDTCAMLLSINADENHVQQLSDCSLDVLPQRYADAIPPAIIFLSNEGSYDGSACNARCSNMLTIDSGLYQSGILSVDASSISNMTLNLPGKDTLGMSSTLFSVCVIDSMLDGYATVIVTDVAGNEGSANFTYCTILDTLAPMITRSADNKTISLSIQDNRPWDRGISTIRIISDSNLNVTFNPPNNWHGLTSIQALAIPIDTSKAAELCLEIYDVAGNKIDTCFEISHSAPHSGIAMEARSPVSLDVLPNPSDDRFDILLSSPVAPGTSAEGEILDLLGRRMAKFHFTDSYEFDAGRLPPGAYILRVNFGQNSQPVTKRIVKE